MLALGSLGLALVVAEALPRILGIRYPVFARVDSVTGVAHMPGRR